MSESKEPAPVVKLNTRVGDQRAKGMIDYETGVIDLTWAPTDVISDLGDLAREEDNDGA